MRKSLLFFFLLMLAFSLMSAISLEKGTEALNNVLEEYRAENKMLPIAIILSEQYDTDMLYSEVQGLTREERRLHTIKTLSEFSDRTQYDLRLELESMAKEGGVTDLRFLWISNVIGLNATVESLEMLDNHPDIGSFHYDPLRHVLMVDQGESSAIDNEDAGNLRDGEREITYNVSNINAPAVWGLGYRGEGATVAVIDTGVNYNHQDLANRMWTHPDYPNHGYDFTSNGLNPMDYSGHGTHCAGTVAGDGNAGSETGVAPEAAIMALRVLDSSGSGQEQWVWDSIQFAVTNGADALSISLGWQHAWSPDRQTWRSVMANTLSAGVTAVVAAGNEGDSQYSNPIPSNVRTPGDCPPPWLNPDQTLTGGVSAVISVGATTSSNTMAGFSSRGPVTWQSVSSYFDYAYNPGMGLIRPDVVAPGVDVKSLRHNNNTGYTFMSGTSMATPCVAGAVALLLSKDPGLIPEMISEILETSAQTSQPVKNNNSGAGKIDALEAISLVVADSPPNIPVNPIPEDEAVFASIQPTLRWTNGGGAITYFVSVGTNNPPTNIVHGYLTEERLFVIEEELEEMTQYYWRVDAMNVNGYTEGEVWTFTTGLAVSEDFETGDFTSHDWQFSVSGTNAQNWEVTSDEAYNGQYSAQSGEIGHNSTTSLYITLEVIEQSVISFYRKVSSESGYDFLRFYIDNSLIAQWSGEQSWEQVSYSVSPGFRTFRWSYVKDQGVVAGQDKVWIDDITFPHLEEPIPPMYPPENVEYLLQLESITLLWDVSDISLRYRDDPVLMGFNIYRLVDQAEEFEMINDDLVQDYYYSDPIVNAGNHSYYITSVYDIGESEPSEIISFPIEPAPANPVFSPEPGEYTEEIFVTIDSEESALTYYTMDGTEPSVDSDLYDEPFFVSESVTIKAKSFKLNHMPSEIIEAEYIISTHAEDITAELVTALSVYPNPIYSSTANRSNRLTLDLSLPETKDAKLIIYNIRGQAVKTLDLSRSADGKSTLHWDLRNDNGNFVGSGIYLLRLSTGKETIHRRIMIIR